MDWLKEMFEAHNQRIKSPIIGSIILAFIAWNWQAVFYVLFASNSVRKRLLHWDEKVLVWQDYLIPVAIGFVLALSMPLISLLGAYASAWPTNKLRQFTNDQTHKVELAKKHNNHKLALTEIEYQQELAERKEELEEQRERLIASKLRQQESLNKIEDEEVRESISAEANEGTEDQDFQLTRIDMENTDINVLIDDIDLKFGRSNPKAIKNRWVHESIAEVAKQNTLGSSMFYQVLPTFVEKNLPDSTLPINANLLSFSNEIANLMIEIEKAHEKNQTSYAERLEVVIRKKTAILQKFYLGLDISEFKFDKPIGK